MKSKGLYGKKFLDIQEREIEIGSPTENQVIVKIHACGVCGTDLNFVRDWENDPKPLGHEIAAEVIEVGKNVTTVSPGDKVIVEDCTMCGICEDCKNGHPELCREMYNLEGQPGMGQYMVVRCNSVDRFDGLDYVSASLTEPLAVCITAIQNAEIPLGGSVLVLGPGPLGLMCARLSKLRGASFVAITGLTADTERAKIRLETAKQLGCDLSVEIGTQNLEEEIKMRFPKGVDRVIVSTPPESLNDAMKVIRFGGIITFFGLDFGKRHHVTFDVNDLIFRKITLRPTFAEPAINFPLSIRLLKEGLVDSRTIVTHTFGFSQAVDIMSGTINGTLPVIKSVMLPNG